MLEWWMWLVRQIQGYPDWKIMGTDLGGGWVKLMFCYEGLCWSYLCFVNRGLLKECQTPSGSTDWCWERPVHKHRSYRLVILTCKGNIKNIQIFTRVDTQELNHALSTCFCVALSKEFPCWAYSSPVGVCVCVSVKSTRYCHTQGSKMIKYQEATGQVRWEEM